MNCIIVDDEELPRRILEQLIAQEPSLDLVEVFSDSIEALKFVNSNESKVQLIFLDIHMPKFTGFDFISSLKTHFQIVLVSADQNFALKAFEFSNVTDYLLKPIQKDRFQKAVLKINQRLEDTKREKSPTATTKGNELYINSDKRLIKINISDINVIEAKGNFIHIRTSVENYLVYSSLKKIEIKLPSSLFLRVHRSFIINFKRIIDIQDNSILIGKELIPVSRRYKPQLLEHLNLL